MGAVDTAQPWRATTFDYSPSNKLLVTMDPAGDLTPACDDSLDRPSFGVDPDGRAVCTSYNGAGDVTLVEKWLTASLSDAACTSTSDNPPASPAINMGRKTTANQYRAYTYNEGGLVASEIDANLPRHAPEAEKPNRGFRRLATPRAYRSSRGISGRHRRHLPRWSLHQAPARCCTGAPLTAGCNTATGTGAPRAWGRPS